MKKLGKITAAIIMALVMSFTAFGCDLITTDNQKDMDQVVATVSIGDGAPTEEIYKKDLVIMYINYGYQYVQSGGYTQKQAFEMIMNNLVNNVIMVQSALAYYAEINNVTTDKFNVDNYITDEEKAEALYATNKAFNDLIDSYIDADEEETEETETSTETTRTAPTNAAAYTEAIEGIDKFWEEYVAENPEADEAQKEFLFYNDYNTKGYLSKGIITGFDDDRITTDIDRKKAYNSVLNALNVNALLGKDFDFETGSIYESEYYTDTLKSQKENILLTNYQLVLQYDVFKTVSYADIAANYAEMYEAQKNNNIADYETAISDASASAPVVYNPYTGYGYVYNLLLGVDSVMTAEISALSSESNINSAEYRTKRNQILQKTTAQDLRSTWITAGYDFDYATKTFTGDYSFASEGNRLPFKGEVEWLNEDEKDEEDYTAKYKITSLEKYGLDEFIELVDTYLYGSVQSNSGDEKYYKKASVATAPDEFDEKMNDVLFAFSTDSGSLNTYMGYVVKPKADIDGSETYVAEFAEASRDVLTMGKGSYIIVGTDYGYHFIYNSKTIEADSGYATLDAYLDSLGVSKTIAGTTYATWAEYYDAMIKDTATYAEDEDSTFYLYSLQQAYVSNRLSTELQNTQTAIVNKYREYNTDDKTYGDYKSEFVRLYTSRYSEYLREN